MSKLDYFRARADTYRQMAMEADNNRMSADMYELAEMFDSIADTCEQQGWASPLRQRLFSISLLIRRMLAR